jgi:hypothetical protein
MVCVSVFIDQTATVRAFEAVGARSAAACLVRPLEAEHPSAPSMPSPVAHAPAPTSPEGGRSDETSLVQRRMRMRHIRMRQSCTVL